MTVVELEDYRPDGILRRPSFHRLGKIMFRTLSFMKCRNQDNNNGKKSRKSSFDTATIVSTTSFKPALPSSRLNNAPCSPLLSTHPAVVADGFHEEHPKEILFVTQATPLLDRNACRNDTRTASLPHREIPSSPRSIATPAESVRSVVSTTSADSLKTERCQRLLSDDQLCDLNTQRLSFGAALATRAIHEQNSAACAETEAHERVFSRWQKGQCARIIIEEPYDEPIQVEVESDDATHITPINEKPTVSQKRNKANISREHCKHRKESWALRPSISLTRQQHNSSLQRQSTRSQMVLTQQCSHRAKDQHYSDPALVARLYAFQLQKDMFGSSHPDTLFAMNNLSNAYRKRGRQEEADRIREEAIFVSRGNMDSRE